MIEFKKITLEDREWMEKYFKESDFRGCDYSFANLYMWSKPSQIEVANVEGMLCIKSKGWNEKEPLYTYPAGNGNIKNTIEALILDAKERKHPFYLRGFEKKEAEKLETCFPERFHIETIRDEWDYIYLAEKLANLSGKKYHGKRNHIARFKEMSDWRYEDICSTNLDDCRKMNEEWCKLYGCSRSKALDTEQCAVRTAFDYFEQLQLKGGILYQGERAVAFTIGEPLNSDTFVVHVEKAFPDIQGAYPMINQQFVQHVDGYTYINREEDLGEEGLRKAKLSYRPEMFAEKYKATLVEG